MSTDGPFVGTYLCPAHGWTLPCSDCTTDEIVKNRTNALRFKNALIEIAVYGSANPQHGFSCASMAKTALSQAGELGTYPLEKEKE